MEEVPVSVVSVPEDITELTEFPHLTNTTLVSLFYFNFFEKTFAAKLRSFRLLGQNSTSEIVVRKLILCAIIQKCFLIKLNFRLIENTEYRLTIDQLQKSKTEQTTENSRDSDRTFSW